MACSTYIHQEDQGLFFLIQISLQTSGFIYVWSQFRPIQIRAGIQPEAAPKKRKYEEASAGTGLSCFFITHLSFLEAYSSRYTLASILWTEFTVIFSVYSLWTEAIEQGRKILFLMAWKFAFIVMDAIKAHLKCKLP